MGKNILDLESIEDGRYLPKWQLEDMLGNTIISKLKKDVNYPINCKLCHTDFKIGIISGKEENISARIIKIDGEPSVEHGAGENQTRLVYEGAILYKGICPACSHVQPFIIERTGKKEYGEWVTMRPDF